MAARTTLPTTPNRGEVRSSGGSIERAATSPPADPDSGLAVLPCGPAAHGAVPTVPGGAR
ncbi:hypothetical protein E2562_028101 [Oryza meyeriana var. granulata]|uniref:Uncharacterized protein n=1 Tax=Oryza meyeriana var. granulata TaxID=110450 RepID=A0A6G1CAZ9_9ORYZ|nr:hypothetical protein E2562_028101 [Oryza meyeriana var. granulata]